MSRRPRAIFVGVTYAGWATRQQNLQRHVHDDGRLDASFHDVTGWRDGGVFERLPLPRPVRGRLRATVEASPLGRWPRPDVVWTSAPELVLPYLPMFAGPLRRPLVVELDWTVRQQEEMAPWYYGRAPRTGRALRWAVGRERLAHSRVSLFTPMSGWAAAGLRAAGVPDERILVLHPGLDLDRWVSPSRPHPAGGTLRVLFVGGDFARKGGDLLLAAVGGPLAGRVTADVVTRDPVTPTPGVTVHRCEANSPELIERYRAAELFVLPTRADCLGHAVVEAAASGLPAIVGDVGGVADVVDHDATGWRIEPTLDSLVGALEAALAQRSRLRAMGAAARRVAEQRFDGRRNDGLLVDAMLELAARRRRRTAERASVAP